MQTVTLGRNGPAVERDRPRLHGHVARRLRALRTKPRASPPSTPRSMPASPDRHRRLLRHGPQRDADPPRAGRRAALEGRDLGEVRRHARSFGRLHRARRPAARGEEFSGLLAASGSAPIISTSTGRPASTRTCRSRTPSARSPTWCAPAMCVTSASRKSGTDTIRRAHAVHPIVDLQIEYSLMSRGIEEKILPTTRELGIAITAYGVLSRGLLSGRVPSADAKGDIRVTRMPRYQQGNIETEPETGRGAAPDRQRKRRDAGAARARLGAHARRRHRARHGRPPPRPAQGNARRARR